MTGREYRKRCVALGYPQRDLCEILQISKSCLYNRWRADVVPREALLALHSLEIIKPSLRIVALMEGRKIRA